MKHTEMIYADHAATTRLDDDAFEYMKQFLLDDFWNASEPYSFAKVSQEALVAARKRIADCINAEPEEIYITSCGSESDNWAIKSVGLEDKNKVVITSCIEHPAILNSCAVIEKEGVKVEYLPVDGKGVVSTAALEELVEKESASLVSVMFVNNEIGTMEPIKELCDIAHAHGALFHTDAVQALGHVAIDVKELGVDMLSASAHKFNGPKGIGFLYAKKGTPLLPFMNGGCQEFGMRAGTENIASIVAMSYALEKNIKNLDENFAHMQELEKLFISELKKTGLDFIVNGSEIKNPGNMSISFKGADGADILHGLDKKGVAVSTGSACNSGVKALSRVLRAIGVSEEYGFGTVRISLGIENTTDDVLYIVKCLCEVLA